MPSQETLLDKQVDSNPGMFDQIQPAQSSHIVNVSYSITFDSSNNLMQCKSMYVVLESCIPKPTQLDQVIELATTCSTQEI